MPMRPVPTRARLSLDFMNWKRWSALPPTRLGRGVAAESALGATRSTPEIAIPCGSFDQFDGHRRELGDLFTGEVFHGVFDRHRAHARGELRDRRGHHALLDVVARLGQGVEA